MSTCYRQLSMEVLTVKTNWDWEVSTCREVLFQTVDTFLTCQDKLFELSRSRVLIETMSWNEILGHKPCQDVSFWAVQTFLTVETSFFKLLRSLNMWRCPFSNCRYFLEMSRQAFWTVEIKSLHWDKLRSRSRCLDMLRCPFSNCQD
jgi:hypothetical protein